MPPVSFGAEAKSCPVRRAVQVCAESARIGEKSGLVGDGTVVSNPHALNLAEAHIVAAAVVEFVVLMLTCPAMGLAILM
jgi:hypothetical protein